MKIKSIVYFIVISAISIQLPAATLTDNFNNGISSTYWKIYSVQVDAVANNIPGGAVGAPWTISNSSGSVEISKPADTDYSTPLNHLNAGLQSYFTIDGDFSVFIDFNLINFPAQDPHGWNEAGLRVSRKNVNDPLYGYEDNFMCLRFSVDMVEGASNLHPYTIGVKSDSTKQGKLGITRHGNLMSAWIDRGSGAIRLGSIANDKFLGAMDLQIAASQGCNYPLGRPHTALDAPFDNLTVTAETIVIPEPASMLLLGLGGLLLSRRKK